MKVLTESMTGLRAAGMKQETLRGREGERKGGRGYVFAFTTHTKVLSARIFMRCVCVCLSVCVCVKGHATCVCL